jgi:hypothetical protein
LLSPSKKNSDSKVRPLQPRRKQERPLGGSASFQGKALSSCSCNEAVIQPERGTVIQYAAAIGRSPKERTFSGEPLLIPLPEYERQDKSGII